jgi:hypothetical protein
MIPDLFDDEIAPEPPDRDPDTENLVREFNRRYGKMGKADPTDLETFAGETGIRCWDEESGEHYYTRLKDATDEGYEEAVGYLALDVADSDYDLAIAILSDPRVEGGWMMGDAPGWLEKAKAIHLRARGGLL